jgi:putative ABC transport system permease protein
MRDFLKDLRFSFRICTKNPGFTAVVLLSLSLGIAATTTIFSVIYEVLLAPSLYKDTHRLVVLWESNTVKGLPKTPVAPATFRDWRESSRSFEGMELVAPGSPVTVTGSELPERANIQYATPGLFSLLGIQPAAGQLFSTEQHKSVDSVVLGYGFWSRHFARNPNIIGRQVTVNGTSQTIVGVLPRDFHLFDQNTDLWMPIDHPNAASQDRSFRSWLIAVGKLRADETLRSAQAEMDVLAQRIEKAHPESNKDWGVKLEPIQEAQFGRWKPILYFLFGIVAFVLLISCANVANLLLGRLTDRSRELCIRASLGAARSRIVKQLLTEGLLLGVFGGLIGWLLAYWGIDLFRAVAPGDFPLLQSVKINLPILSFCLTISILSGVIVSVSTAFFASRLDFNGVLKSTTPATVGRAYRRYRDSLVVAEIALSLVLLSGAGLMINSLLRLLRIDPGFRSSDVVTTQLFLSGPKYFEFSTEGVHVREEVGDFYRHLLERTSALPGVESIGLVSWLPEMGYNTGRRERAFRILGQYEGNGSGQFVASFNAVSPSYFNTLQIPLLRGRNFDSHDNESNPWVAIVNEAFVHRYWARVDPIGKQLLTDGGSNERARQVIGVIANVRQNGLDENPDPEIFVPYLQQPRVSSPHGYQNRVHMTLVLRTALEPAAVIAEIRRIAAEMDESQPVYGTRTMSEVLAESTSLRRLYARLLELIAGIALFLSAIGIYGVMSHSVSQRTSEIGLRMAIGADASDVLRLVFSQGAKLIFAGLGIGLALALILDRFLASYLFGIRACDPPTMFACSVLLVAIAVGAIWIPARRASRVDPIVALRVD